jgi:Asp-tRNA(Asn)/Glu-tRNA(Gln) amidotransferase C subunit
MAEKRMFTQKIIDSDPFLDMPLSTQALYFHLNMRADDDGFVNNPKRIQRTIGASEDDLKLLIAKRFLIGFENGVIVIKHWRMHNTLRKDRYNPTQYQEELAMLDVKENKSYTEKALEIPVIDTVATTWQPNGNHLEPQYSIGKYSIDKNSIDIISDSIEPEPPAKPKKEKPVKHKYGEYNNVLLTDEELQKLKTEYSDYEKRIENLSSYIASTGKSYKSHYATIRNWARKDAEKPGRKEIVPDWMQKKTKFNNFEGRNYSPGAMDDLTRALIAADEPKTAANDPELRKRVEAMKEKLGAQ